MKKPLSQREAERWLPNHARIGDEKIMFFLRRHWFVLFVKFLFLLILALMPIAVYALVQTMFPSMMMNEVGKAFLTVLASLYYLFIWISVYTLFVDYYLDIWIVTTHRIVDREQKGLFNHVISEQSLEQVQDVSSTVKGVFPTLLDYGQVLIQSAGATNLFNFKQIPEPEVVSRRINKLAEEFRLSHREHIGQD